MKTSTFLPEGFLAAPVSAADAGAALRLCAVLRRPARAGAAATLVPLGSGTNSARYLGCVRDRGGRVREWLEWNVQSADDLPAPALAAIFGNAALDADWTRRAASLLGLAPGLFLETGWERTHPAPMFLDPAGGEPADTSAWKLCRNPAALAAAGLPAYEESLHRYLWNRSGEFPLIVPGTPGAPAPHALTSSPPAAVPGETPAPRQPPPASIAEVFPAHVAFNPAAGLLTARTFVPLGLEEFADVLGGRPWKGLRQGLEQVPLDPSYQPLREMEAAGARGGRLLQSRRGPAGRAAETLHLKLHLLLDAARQIRELVRATGSPMFDLTADSFAVTLGERAGGCPFLWTARAVLVRPGKALAVEGPAVGPTERYFLPRADDPTRPEGRSIYWPDDSGRVAAGTATVELDRWRGDAPDGTAAVEGVLHLQENLPRHGRDLLRLRLRAGGGACFDLLALDLLAAPGAPAASLAGKVRFRALPTTLPPRTLEELRRGGMTFTGARFHVLPLLGTPCDLYALGVLAVRVLLVDEHDDLPTVLAAVRRLVWPAPLDAAEAAPLASRLEDLAREDPQWSEVLDPRHLFWSEALPDPLPPALWWEVVAAVVRCFPGAGIDSRCENYGDAPGGRPEVVFDRFIRDLEVLTGRTRCLLLGDSEPNLEILAAIRRVAERTP